jgi:N-formylglutamate amidohydrolase
MKNGTLCADQVQAGTTDERSANELAGDISDRFPNDELGLDIVEPKHRSLPLVLASPHSGRDYSQAFLAASRLDALALRRSEDSFVDELFAGARGLGAPLLRAHFPRAYVDPNREPYELDPSMFVDSLPEGVNTQSARVRGGLGIVARVVADGSEIYREKLCFEDADFRIRKFYRPYHAALTELIQVTKRRFGFVILIDCHSMPSVGGPMDSDAGSKRADFILGDRHGTSCHPVVTVTAERVLKQRNFTVRRNTPYAGGFTVQHYGCPEEGVHALQIEINRATYMDEARICRGPHFAEITAEMTRVMAALGRIDPVVLDAARCSPGDLLP